MGALVGEKNFDVIKMHGTTIKKGVKNVSNDMTPDTRYFLCEKI